MNRINKDFKRMKQLKHKYIILGSNWDLYIQSYSDLKMLDSADYIESPLKNLNYIENILFRIHTHPKSNICKLPFKAAWLNPILGASLKKSDDLCFIVFSNWVTNDQFPIFEILRTQYPNAKIVWFLQDLFDTLKYQSSRQKLDLSNIKNHVNLIASFDPGDCNKYGFVYHPLVFSKYIGEIEEMPESDVFFLGRAKGRLADIIKVYEILKREGLTLDFNIVGVEECDRKYKSEINYIDGMSYNENLQHILHTKCELEIMQEGGIGYTQRTNEVVCLDKKLLTNNPIIQTTPFYNPDYISVFSSAEDLDLDFIRRIKDKTNVDYNYKDKLSPVALLKFIDDKI